MLARLANQSNTLNSVVELFEVGQHSDRENLKTLNRGTEYEVRRTYRREELILNKVYC